MLFQMRYKRGMTGIATAFVEVVPSALANPDEAAKDELARAERVGSAFCNSFPGYKYIHIERAVVADESILAAPAPVAPKASGRPAKANTAG
jgi:hypothetical protein